MSTVQKLYWSSAPSWVFMHFANHYQKFQWKQSRRLTDARQCLTSRLPGIETELDANPSPNPNPIHWWA